LVPACASQADADDLGRGAPRSTDAHHRPATDAAPDIGPLDGSPDTAGDAAPAADAEAPDDAASPSDTGPRADAAPSCAHRAHGAECVTDDHRWGRCADAGCLAVEAPDDPEVCDGDDGDVCADTWVVVDGLGRAVPGAARVGPPRPDRTVAMFYWIWHEAARGGPFDVTRILTEDPVNPGWGPVHAPHHWGEPELGYYTSADPFVYRKHAALLADAGVDVLVFDTSNTPFTWPEHYQVLCAVLDEMQAAGDRTPGIAFLAPFWDPPEVVRRVFQDLYLEGRCRSHWFHWEGRPLILADPDLARDRSCDGCTAEQGCDVACQGIGQRSGTCAHPGSVDAGRCCLCYPDQPTLFEFFTFRKPMPSYFDGPSGVDQWSWMEVFPQHVFRDRAGEAEQMAVSVAQNATDRELKPMSLQAGIHGRTWHGGRRDEAPDAVRRGGNFQEQWTRALEVDPRVVFVTGWNEWVAGRFEEWQGVGGGAVFPDQYNQEYSRDLEPMRGGHGDDYYYQLMGNVRRYKGARRLPRPSPPRTVPIGDGFAEWSGVLPVYRDTVGDTAHRDAPGYGGLRYQDRSGRNDIVEARVTWDATSIFFYVQTAAELTPWDSGAWMLLGIDSDHDRSTGWRGYEYAVEATGPETARVTRLPGGAQVALAPLFYAGAELELAVPRGAIDQAGPPRLTFHWSDNPIDEAGEIPAFGRLGDNAPNRRASYDFVAR